MTERILVVSNSTSGLVSFRKELLEISSSSLNTLLRKKIIKEEKKEHYRIHYDREVTSLKQLTEEQQEVVSEVIHNPPKNYLLYGVTGSGKTEVYLQLIKKVLDEQKTAIVLVPEISLTPQMLDRFISRFGKDEIAVLHSKLSIGERHDEWKKIKER